MRRIIIFLMLVIIPFPVTFTFAEEMTITTYYPSPNGAYDALNVKRLSVGDTNGDGKINASDVSASSGYLLVADKLGIGTTSPGNNKLYVAANDLQGIRVASAADANLGIGLIKGTGDGADITTYNGALESWYGIAFRSSLDGGVRYTFNTRTGNTYIAGNVGIGTTAPNHLLQLTKSHNSGTTADMFRVNYDDNWGLRLRQNYTGAGNIQYDFIQRYASTDYNVLTFKGGNVGIGTTSPQGRLDIAGGDIANVRAIYALTDGTTNIDLLYHQNNSLYIKSGASSGKVFIGAGGEVPLCVFGNVGIGTESPAGKLDIAGGDMILHSDSSIGVLRVGGANTSSSGRLDIASRDGDVMFRMWTDSAIAQVNSAEGGSWTSASFDLAEKINYENEVSIEAGDIIVSTGKKEGAIYADKSSYPYQETIIGIVSTQPAFVGGVPWEENPSKSPVTDKALSLAGRVPAKVCTENGTIKVGDYLTSSSIPGVAMKATKPGQVVGKAMEEYKEKNPKKVGKITVFVNPVWFGADLEKTIKELQAEVSELKQEIKDLRNNRK
ncbi:MAG: tail fiber protein [Candidatus Omnitrophota bacterium]